MQEDIVDTQGLSRAEKNEKLEEWMNRVLFDQDYTEVYRMIFMNYKRKIKTN